ncbi:Tlg2-vesicle protein [Dispira parvispora]|uniref:Golgi apparatus membrane protein TVP38 n=1 Tax=Dispira parvispora TaxID=1520584 RepID=A0A9W8AJU8_9FUNG|nr:Tlg2-vesicle protein [Dispira parvispora]
MASIMSPDPPAKTTAATPFTEQIGSTNFMETSTVVERRSLDPGASTLATDPSTLDDIHTIDIDPAEPLPGAVAAQRGLLTDTVLAQPKLLRYQRWIQATVRNPWFTLAMMVASIILSGVLFWLYHEPILAWLEDLGLRIRSSGFVGVVIMTFLIFLTAFPPVFGYSTLTTLTGFAYGFPLGFIPCFLGALSGSVACFVLCRKYGQNHLRWLFNWNPHITATVQAIELKGFKLLLLIRLSPYPFNLVNALLSGTQIPLKTFTLATAVSLIKLNTHVYIGANLTTFSNAIFERRSPWQVVLMVVGICMGVGVMVYIYRITQRMVDNMADIPLEHLPNHSTDVNTSAYTPVCNSGNSLDLPIASTSGTSTTVYRAPSHQPQRASSAATVATNWAWEDESDDDTQGFTVGSVPIKRNKIRVD